MVFCVNDYFKITQRIPSIKLNEQDFHKYRKHILFRNGTYCTIGKINQILAEFSDLAIKISALPVYYVLNCHLSDYLLILGNLHLVQCVSFIVKTNKQISAA